MNWREVLSGISSGDEHSLLDVKKYFFKVSQQLIRKFSLIDIDEDDLFQLFFEHIIASGTLEDIIDGTFDDPGAILGKSLNQVAIEHSRYLNAQKRDFRKTENKDLDFFSSNHHEFILENSGFDVDFADFLEASLSQEELQVLYLLSDGFRSREIADTLGISVSTASRRIVELRCRLQTVLTALS